jgi:hypothetical protein
MGHQVRAADGLMVTLLAALAVLFTVVLLVLTVKEGWSE